jgi:molecular chaperone DnaK
MYEQAQGAAGPDMGGQAAGGSNEAGYDDDIIDADYKEV